MKTQFSNSKLKISEEVLTVINEISKAIVVEAAIRAAKQASISTKKVVELEHVEAILPQLVKFLLFSMHYFYLLNFKQLSNSSLNYRFCLLIF